MADSTFYKTLDHDPSNEFVKNVTDAICEMRNGDHTSEKHAVYLTVDRSKVGRFYLLSKIHKAANPGRHIVSANGHRSEKISEFVDVHLHPHVQNLPSYLQDTTDFVRKQDAMGPFLPETLLVSMSHPSAQIYHIEIVSKHVKRFGKHSLLKHPDTNSD